MEMTAGRLSVTMMLLCRPRRNGRSSFSTTLQ